MPQITKTQMKERLDKQGFSGPGALKYFQQTHLGPNGKPLAVNGLADDDTQWALRHPTGKSQKSNLVPKIPRGIIDGRYKILSLALEEHAKGVKERPNGSNRSREIDKYFPGWMKRKLKPKEKGPAWCAFFVNWLFSKVLNKRPWGGYIGSCKRLVKAAQKSDKCTVFSNPEKAAPGDIFVILHGNTGHTGVVLRKNNKSSKINTVEGNCGNRVKVGVRDTDTIAWYIRVMAVPEKLTSPLLAVASVGAAGTR